MDFIVKVEVKAVEYHLVQNCSDPHEAAKHVELDDGYTAEVVTAIEDGKVVEVVNTVLSKEEFIDHYKQKGFQE